MKKAIFFLLVTLSLFQLHAMQVPSQTESAEPKKINEDPILLLKNNTGTKIEVVYTLNDGPSASVTLDDNEEVKLTNVLANLAHLYVVPYGKAKGWASISALTAGYVKSEDLALQKEVVASKKVRQSLRITVKSAGEGWIFGALVSAVRPYKYEFSTITIKKGKPQFIEFLEFFPQAQKAFQEKRPLLARYFLNVAEGAEPLTINVAATRLISQWEPKLGSIYSDEVKLSKRALQFINSAKSKLLQIDDKFDGLVKDLLRAQEKPVELYYVTPDVYEAKEVDPFLGVEFADITKLSEEEKEDLRVNFNMTFPGDPDHPSFPN